MKATLVVLFGFFLALVQCQVSVFEEAGLEHFEKRPVRFGVKPVLQPDPIPGQKQDCIATDACADYDGYCITDSQKGDCDGLLFPNECKSALCSCCVQATLKQDECAEGTDTCPANSTCQDKEAGYECPCKAGFEQCGDINECDNDPCGAGFRCQNTAGSYECICDSGFEIVNDTCVDVNECNSSKPVCSDVEQCINTPGSYSCVCQKCSPQCERGGVLVFGSKCVRLSEFPGLLFGWHRAQPSCGYPSTLFPMETQEQIDVIGSLVLPNDTNAAWVMSTPNQRPYMNSLCPAIERNGTSIIAKAYPCNTQFTYVICQSTREW